MAARSTTPGARAVTLTSNNAQSWAADFTFGGSNNLNLGTGAVTLTANRTATIAAGTLTVGGNIGGAFSLAKAGAGVIILSGNSNYSGGTTLSAGTMDINSATAIGTGTFTINGGSFDNTSGAAITLSNNNSQTWASDFTFVGSNGLNLGTGAVTLTSNRVITVTAGTLTVGGTIGDSGNNYSLSSAGAGTLTLGGANTFGGGVTVVAGTLLADNSSGSAGGTGNVIVDSGATLGGTGTISGAVTVNSGGTLAPGDGGTAIFNTGTLTLSPGSNLDAVLNGNTAGAGYDQVNVNGNVSVTNAILNLSVRAIGARWNHPRPHRQRQLESYHRHLSGPCRRRHHRFQRRDLPGELPGRCGQRGGSHGVARGQLHGIGFRNESIGLWTNGDLHGDRDLDRVGNSHRDRDLPGRLDDPGDGNAQRLGSRDAHHLRPERRRRVHHRSVRRRYQFRDQHVFGCHPDGQPGCDDFGDCLISQSFSLWPICHAHRNGYGQRRVRGFRPAA